MCQKRLISISIYLCSSFMYCIVLRLKFGRFGFLGLLRKYEICRTGVTEETFYFKLHITAPPNQFTARSRFVQCRYSLCTDAPIQIILKYI